MKLKTIALAFCIAGISWSAQAQVGPATPTHPYQPQRPSKVCSASVSESTKLLVAS